MAIDLDAIPDIRRRILECRYKLHVPPEQQTEAASRARQTWNRGDRLKLFEYHVEIITLSAAGYPLKRREAWIPAEAWNG